MPNSPSSRDAAAPTAPLHDAAASPSRSTSTLPAARALPAWLARLRPLLSAHLPAALVVTVGAWVMIAYSLGQWRAMTVPSWDLAIFSEAAKSYSEGHWPIVEIKGPGYNLLGDHFHPILVVLGLVWAIFPTPLALLVVQALLIAVSAWPLTRLATRLLGPWIATVLGLAYVLSWGFQGATQAQFHEIAFAVPFLAWAGVAFVEKRWWATVCWSLPLLLVKEDLGLTLLMVGVVLAGRGWFAERRAARETAPASALGQLRAGTHDGTTHDGAEEPSAQESPLTVEGSSGQPGTHAPHQEEKAGKVPAASATWKKIMAWKTELEADPVALGLWTIFLGLSAFLLVTLVILPALNPDGSWAYSLSSNSDVTWRDGWDTKIQTIALLALAAGLIGVRSPWILLVLPTLAWRFLGSVSYYWDWQYWHYNAVLMPIVMAALLDVVARRPWSPVRWKRWVIRGGALLPAVTMLLLATDLPLWSLTREGWGERSARADAAQEVIDLIEEGSTVETDLGLLAYLVPTATVSWVGTSDGGTDYVVIDQLSSAWGGNPPSNAEEWAEEQSGLEYTLIYDGSGYQVARRDS